MTTGVPNTPKRPQKGETWRSRDPRDDGLRVKILSVGFTKVEIQRFRRTRVSLHRFHRDYEFVADE